MMQSIAAAFSFLTVIRVPGRDVSGEDLAGSPAWFPAVGLALGLGLSFIGWLAGLCDVPRVAAFLGVAFLAGMTRGLHLDGLADWADGFGGSSREETLRIMADSKVGSFGITALVIVLMGRYLCLSEIFSGRGGYGALLLAPVISRWILSYFLVSSPYAREEGTASIFKRDPPPLMLQKASVFVLVCILVVSPLTGFVYWGAAFGVSGLIYLHSRSKIGGITGDVLGAMAEVSELCILTIASIF